MPGAGAGPAPESGNLVMTDIEGLAALPGARRGHGETQPRYHVLISLEKPA